MSLVRSTMRPGSLLACLVLFAASADAAAVRWRAPAPLAARAIGPAGHWVQVPRDTLIPP